MVGRWLKCLPDFRAMDSYIDLGVDKTKCIGVEIVWDEGEDRRTIFVLISLVLRAHVDSIMER